MKILLTLTSILLAVSVKSFAHGEDKLGPNGGYLKMPGGFHTEVVPEKSGKIKVYLLDINFKNPTVKKSKLAATHDNGVKKELNCSVKRDHFICDTTKGDLTKGTLTVLAERNEAKGTTAIYELPLTLSKTSTEQKADDHGSHH